MTGDALVRLLGRSVDDAGVRSALDRFGIEEPVAEGHCIVGDSFDAPGVEFAFVDQRLDAVSFGMDFEVLPRGLAWDLLPANMGEGVAKPIRMGGGEPSGSSVECVRDGVRLLLVFDHGQLVSVTASIN
jgi:hypothetical protein